MTLYAIAWPGFVRHLVSPKSIDFLTFSGRGNDSVKVPTGAELGDTVIPSAMFPGDRRVALGDSLKKMRILNGGSAARDPVLC
jgi:hypothetical protein